LEFRNNPNEELRNLNIVRNIVSLLGKKIMKGNEIVQFHILCLKAKEEITELKIPSNNIFSEEYFSSLLQINSNNTKDQTEYSKCEVSKFETRSKLKIQVT
jgi:hypothetical protein